MLHMTEDVTINTFTGKLTTLANKAATLGHTIEDQTLVRKLLNFIPDRYLQIVVSIEQYSNLSEMTMEEAIGRLRTYEERIKTKANEKSNLVEEDLEPTLLIGILEESDEGKQVKEVEEQKVSWHEEDVGYKEINMDSLWYLDNEASNHMTGVREHFKELDEKVSGKARLGHLNFESLRSMAQRDLVHGIPAIKHTTQIYDVCLIGKHSRAPFPKKAKAKDKENCLEHPIPAALVALPGQQVPSEALVAHVGLGQKEVDVIMLLTMDLEIHRNLAHLGAYDMLQELKALYSKQAEQELL
nr:zinc finger, CCHC-type [Tanacetum cinerariifolium]